MSHPSIHQLSASSGEFLEPPQSSKPIIASGFELRPGFIAMSRCRWGRYGEPGTYPYPYPQFNCPFYTLSKFIHTHLSIPIG